jgi:two-component system, sensor histidine kinase and response regulator
MGQFIVVENQPDVSNKLLGVTPTRGNDSSPQQQTDNEKKPDHDNRAQSSNSVPWRDSVGISLFRSVFMVYCGVTILVTAMSLLAEYNKTSDAVKFQLQKLQEGFEHTLIHAIWELDQKQISAVLYGMGKNPIISGVSITNSDGSVFGRIGELPQDEIDLPLHTLLPKTVINSTKPASRTLSRYEFDLITTGQSLEKIGQVHLYWDQNIIINEVSYEFTVLILGALVKTLALWFIFIQFQRPILSTPMTQIIQYIRSLDKTNIGKNKIRIATRRFNEFKVLESYINTMTQRLAAAYQEIEQKNHLLKKEMLTQQKLEEARRQKSISDEANRAKSMFLATMSHEIRSPMTGIEATTELLQRTNLDSKQQVYLDTIISSNKNLLAIVNDILDINKIESGQLSLDEVVFDIRELLTKLVTLMQPQSESKKIPLILNIDHNIPTLLTGDPLRIQQILLNLLGNAIKFTNAGTISIFLILLKRQNGSVDLEFQIRDTGIGIPAESLPILFDPFVQVDNSLTRRFKGTGLGLSICQKLVTMMAGDIQVESVVGTGTVFRVTIELQEWGNIPNQEQKHQENTRKNSRSGLKILLVEDEPVSQMFIAELLNHEGYRTTTASDGFEALEIVKKQAFDAILMDIRMPGIDGFETTRRIRTLGDENSATTPVFAFSSETLKDTDSLCQKAGMNGILTKPIKLEQLALMLHDHT